MSDYRTWWGHDENGLAIISRESLTMASLWFFSQFDFDEDERRHMDWEDTADKLCIWEQLWAIQEGLA